MPDTDNSAQTKATLALFIISFIISVVACILSVIGFVNTNNTPAKTRLSAYDMLPSTTQTTTFDDADFRIFHDSDPTKLLAFSAEFIDNSTTRSIFVPNANGFFPTLNSTDSLFLNGVTDISAITTESSTVFGITLTVQSIGSRAVSFGYEASSGLSYTGDDNTLIGNTTNCVLTTGSQNTWVGHNRPTITTGDGNILLGNDIVASSDNVSHAIVIGSGGTDHGNNTISLYTSNPGLGLFVNAIRNIDGTNILKYNTSTFECTYGTLATSGQALTTGNNTNVTLTASGSPSTCVVNAVSLTMGWTGVLSIPRGGTGNTSLTATAGALLYCDGTQLVTSSVGTVGQYLQGQTASAPIWSTGITAVTSFGSGTPNDSQSVAIASTSQTAMGTNALQVLISSNANSGANTGYGRQALAALTDVSGNVSNSAFGYFSGALLTLGSDNSLLGHRAGGSLPGNAAIIKNIGIGSYALGRSTSILAADNIGIGYFALGAVGFNSTNCLGIGELSLSNNTTGTNNVCMGAFSGSSITTGTSNASLGYGSLSGNLTGVGNSILGHNAQSVSSSSVNYVSALGFEACMNNTADNITAMGSGALRSNTSGARNSAMGYQSLYSNTIGSDNSGCGHMALWGNSTGSRNSAFGYMAQSASANVLDVVAVGASCCLLNTASEITAVGYFALSSNSGIENTALGSQALRANTTGSSNTCAGLLAALLNTTGSYNTTIGRNSFSNNVSGGYNIALGTYAQQNNLNGVENVSIGVYSMADNSGIFNASNYNVIVGFESMGTFFIGATRNSIFGDYNVGIGIQTVVSNASTPVLGYVNLGSACGVSIPSLNSVCIGDTTGSSAFSGNNSVTFNYNSNTTSINYFTNTIYLDTSIIRDNLAIRLPALTCFLDGIRDKSVNMSTADPVFVDSAGQLGTVSSSKRFKTNIQTLDPAPYYDLEPVSFQRLLDDGTTRDSVEYGLIAEDVAKIDTRLVNFNEKGEPETVYYQYLTPILLAMCNDLKQRNDAYIREYNETLSEIQEYQKRFDLQFLTTV